MYLDLKTIPLALSILPLLSATLVAAPPEKKQAAVDLTSKDTLSDWTTLNGEPVSEGWKIENGVIHRHARGGDIITKKKYKNFELSFEWKISKGGNSGVKYRTKGKLGLEYQVLDDKENKDNKDKTHRAASLYELVAAPDDKPLKPVGEWNEARIVVNGNLIEHWLNGKKVVSLTYGSDNWKKKFSESKYKKNEGFGSWEGPILLQDHGNEAWFRNLKISQL